MPSPPDSPAPAATPARNSHTFVSVVTVLQDASFDVATRVPALWRILHDAYENFEVVLVDDGTRDGTLHKVQALLDQHDCLRIVRLSRQFGREAALAAGLDAAIGDVVVAIDVAADPIDAIPKLVRQCVRGSGAIIGVDPERRGETALQKAAVRAFYWLAERLAAVELIRDATGLLVLSRPALGALLRLREQAYHLQVFLPFIGFELQTWAYQPAGPGKASRGLLAGLGRAADIIVTGSLRPLRVVSWLSLLAATLNGTYLVYVVLIALFRKHVAEGWTTLSLQHGVMFFLLFLVLAVLSEYVGRILAESRRRPTWVVRDEFNSSVVVQSDQRRNVVNDSE